MKTTLHVILMLSAIFAFLCPRAGNAAKAGGRVSRPDGHVLNGEDLPLTLLPDGKTLVNYNSAAFDFGEVDAMDGAITHAFILKNSGHASVIIDRLQTSCGCTTTSIGSQPQGLHMAVIEPGETVPIHVSIDASALYPGKIEKTVWIYINGNSAPIATLNLTGILSPCIVISPNVVDFGQITPGSAAHSTVIVKMDERLYSWGSDFILTSSIPTVAVNRVSRTLAVRNRHIYIQDAYRVDYTPRTPSDSLQSTLSVKMLKNGVSNPLPPGTLSIFAMGRGSSQSESP